MTIRKVPNGLRVDGVLIPPHEYVYKMYLQIWEKMKRLKANARLKKHREKRSKETLEKLKIECAAKHNP